MMVRLPGQPGTKAQENLKRYRVASVCGVESRGLGIKSYVCAQAQLPRARLCTVALGAEGVCADAISDRQGRCRKQFVFIHQLQPGEGVISFEKIQRGFEQVTVEISAGGNLVHTSPDQRRSPVSASPMSA